VLNPILDPLDRPPGLPRGNRQQDDIREDRLFDAKAAARIRRRLEPQPARRHTEGQRHDRVECEGTLEVGGDLVGVLPGEMLGDDDETLDRRAAIARIVRGDRDALRRRGKGGFRVAVAEAPVADDIVSGGDARIEHGRQRAVCHVDGFERVLGPVTVARDDNGNRLALIAHARDRETPMLDRRFDGGDQGPGPALGVLAGHHAIDTRHGQCPGRVDRQDLGMGVRRAQYRGVQSPRRHRQIVGIAATAG
jgi:hypothetical protein